MPIRGNEPVSEAINRLIIRDEGDGKISVALRRAGQEETKRAGDPFAFTFPLDDQAREDLRWYLEDYLPAPYAVWEDRGQAIADKLAGWGEALFQAVFGAGEPYNAYTTARKGLAELVIHAASPDVLGLPWELLKDPDWPSPLALEANTVGIARMLGEECEATEAPPGESLRVLMVIARPRGKDDVQYQLIARPLLERLSAVRGQVMLEVLRPPTFEALEQRLKQTADDGRPYHLLHFDGHGVLHRSEGDEVASGKGYVLFEEPTGGARRVTAADFARIVSDGRVPLVVLNACQSGAMPEQADAAVATRLLLDSAASVVAMGYIVYTVAAAEFMAAFYQALFEGKEVSAAVDAGRERLARKAERPSPKGPLPLADWMVPVHYRRRAVAFPQLRPTPARTELSLDAALDQMRTAPRLAAEKPGADVHAEGSIEPIGRFVGRDSFVYTLELECRHHRVVLVHGPGGTGKTELAKAFARWWRDTGGLGDPEWVFFHSFEPGLASFGLAGVINALGIRLFGADFIGRTEGPEQRRTLILQTLRQRRMLLIWDNFESVFSMPDPGIATPRLSQAQLDEFLEFRGAIRSAGASTLILTSRSEEDWMGKICRLKLSGLASREAVEYADDLLEPYPEAQARREDRAFGDLMVWLAGHPLSMRLILPHLRDVTAADLLTGLRGMGPLPKDLQASDGRLESLGASVKYSLDHLPAYIRRLLPAVSLFEGVADENVLVLFSAADGVPARFAGTSQEVWQAVLAETERVGLLTPLGGGQYVIHPALPAYLAAQWRVEAGVSFEVERSAARWSLLAAYAEFARSLLRQIRSGAAETAFALIDRQQRTMGTLLVFALAEQHFVEAQKIMQPLNDFWDARGLTLEANSWVNRVRTAIEGPKGEMPDLDNASGKLWNFAANSKVKRAIRAGDLAEAEAVNAEIHLGLVASPKNEIRDKSLAVSLHNFGMIAQLRDELVVAEGWYRKSLKVVESYNDHPKIAAGYHQLGFVAELRGDLAAAEDWYQKSRAIEETLGNLLGMASSCLHLGRVAQLRSELVVAKDRYRKSLTIFESLDHRLGMASSYHQLGTVAHVRGNLVEAESCYQKSLAIKEALGDRPGMATSYHQLGRVSEDRGDLDTTEKWYWKSLNILETLNDRSKMAGSYHQLGVVAQKRGDFAAAEERYLKSLAIQRVLGDRPGIVRTCVNLVVLAEIENDIPTALDWTVRSVALFDSFPHPLTGEASANLVAYTRKLGLFALEESWLRCTGQPLPEDVRFYVEQRLRDGDA